MDDAVIEKRHGAFATLETHLFIQPLELGLLPVPARGPTGESYASLNARLG